MLVPAAVIAVLGLLRRYLPARAARSAQHSRVIEDFSGVNVAVYGCMIVVGITFVLFMHWALVAGNRYFAKADGPGAFVFFPSGAIWWFLPGFGALCLTWELTLFICSIFAGREKITRFIDWTNERAGYDSTRALRWMALLLVLPIGVASVLAIPLHSTLRDSDIVVGRYAKLARQNLVYSQANRLAVVDGFRNRDGRFTPRAEVILDFTDGTRWRSADNADFAKDVDPGLVEFLARKTGLVVERAQTEADLAH